MEGDLKNPQERNEELFHADEGNNYYEMGDFFMLMRETSITRRVILPRLRFQA